MTQRDDDEREQGRKQFEVGYGKPPKRTRFVKGSSGNPKGRPRGARNKPVELQAGLFRDIFLREGQRELTTQDGGQTVNLSMLEAAIRKIFVDALKGRPRAQELVMKYAAEISRSDQELDNEFQRAMIEWKVNSELDLERMARLGIIDQTDMFPYPHDIVVDFATGNVKITGPRSKEEKEAIGQLREIAIALRAIIEDVSDRLASETDPDTRTDLEQMRSRARDQLTPIEDVLSGMTYQGRAVLPGDGVGED